MRIVIGGYVAGEGRVSMMRTAHSIARHAAPMLDTNDEISLVDPRARDHCFPAAASGRVRIQKRFLAPARLAATKADVIHLIDSDHAYGIAPWNFRRILVTCHDLMPFWLDPTLKTIYRGRLGRYFCRRALRNLARCAHVACVSEYTRQRLLAQVNIPEARTSTIPQAVESHFCALPADHPGRRAFVEKLRLCGKRVVLHVGVCMPYKNIGGLLEVFRRLVADGHHDVVLLKIGGHFAPDEEAFITRHGLGDRIVHRTGLSESDLVRAYNAADLLLWPSFMEGFGLPVLEAMACGTPVVCSNGGALAEVADCHARVHDPNDLEGMADSCREILGDEALAARMGEAGIAHARTYSWERAARAYLERYRQVADGGGK